MKRVVGNINADLDTTEAQQAIFTRGDTKTAVTVSGYPGTQTLIVMGKSGLVLQLRVAACRWLALLSTREISGLTTGIRMARVCHEPRKIAALSASATVKLGYGNTLNFATHAPALRYNPYAGTR